MRNQKEKIDYYADLVDNSIYHIFNRSNNQEIIFIDEEDRITFLTKYKEYLLPYVDTYCYCLLGNHFHLQVRTKDLKTIFNHINHLPRSMRTTYQRTFLETEKDFRIINDVISHQFSRLFISYAMWFNSKYKRQGNLFYRRFKRILVDNESYFSMLIYYIHANPVLHKIRRNFTNYKWSSYQTILSEQPTDILRTEVLEWFGGKKEFIQFHLGNPDIDEGSVYFIE